MLRKNNIAEQKSGSHGEPLFYGADAFQNTKKRLLF